MREENRKRRTRLRQNKERKLVEMEKASWYDWIGKYQKEDSVDVKSKSDVWNGFYYTDFCENKKKKYKFCKVSKTTFEKWKTISRKSQMYNKKEIFLNFTVFRLANAVLSAWKLSDGTLEVKRR